MLALLRNPTTASHGARLMRKNGFASPEIFVFPYNIFKGM
jgi:hypothetical protein